MKLNEVRRAVIWMKIRTDMRMKEERSHLAIPDDDNDDDINDIIAACKTGEERESYLRIMRAHKVMKQGQGTLTRANGRKSRLTNVPSSPPIVSRTTAATAAGEEDAEDIYEEEEDADDGVSAVPL
jgi:hypothetical protein